jgi:hypothetical protein
MRLPWHRTPPEPPKHPESAPRTRTPLSRITLVDPCTRDAGTDPVLMPRHMLIDGAHVGPIEDSTLEVSKGNRDEPARVTATFLPSSIEVRGWRPWDDCLLEPESLYPWRRVQIGAAIAAAALTLLGAGALVGRTL